MAHTAPAPASFEEAVSRLETLIRDMESGQLPLEASLAAYQQGSELIRFARRGWRRPSNSSACWKTANSNR